MLAFKYGVGQDCPGCSAFVLCLLRTSTVGVCTGTCIVIHYLNSHQSQPLPSLGQEHPIGTIPAVYVYALEIYEVNDI